MASITDGIGLTTQWQYDGEGNLTEVKREGISYVVNRYDGLGRLIQRGNSKGFETYQYDGAGNITVYTNKNGEEFRYAYDGAGMLLQTEDPEGGVVTYGYDDARRLIREKTALGLEVHIDYDPVGNVVKMWDHGGADVMGYDKDGNRTYYQDRNGNEISYFYTDTGLLERSVTEVDGPQNIVEYKFSYDAKGNLTSMLDPKDLLLKYKYDWAGMLTGEMNQLGHWQYYEHDANFNQTAVIDPVGNRTTYTYDGIGQLTGIVDPEGRTSLYEYDVFGNLSAIRQLQEDGSYSVTRMESDPWGNPLSEMSPLQEKKTFETDPEGNVTKIVDEDGNVNLFEYDGMSRQSVVRYGTAEPIFYTYDAGGNILQVDEEIGSSKFRYDPWGQLVYAEDHLGHVTEYEYDAKGNQTKITYPNGEVTAYTYDHMDRMVKTASLGKVKEYQYDFKSQLLKEIFPSGETISYTYDNAGYLTRMIETDDGGVTVRDTAYLYLDNGLMWQETRKGVDLDFHAENLAYRYDGSGFLVESKLENVSTKYHYDMAGNLVREEGAEGITEYQYNQANQLVKSVKTPAAGEAEGELETTTFAYDKRGNLVLEKNHQGEKEFRYDAASRLIEGVNESGEKSWYTYNGLGARVGHTEERDNYNAGHQNGEPFPSSWATSETIRKILEEGRETWQRVWESRVGTVVQNDRELVQKNYVVDYTTDAYRDLYIVEEGSFIQSLIYDRIQATPVAMTLEYADGTDRAIASGGENPGSDIAANLTKEIWYHGGLLGSNTYGVDESGDILFHMISDIWGVPQIETRVDMNFHGLDNLNNFTGYSYDEVLSVYFAQARFYDPETKRFIQKDPAKYGANWYLYCDNNPVNYTDPLGRKPLSVLEGNYVNTNSNAGGKPRTPEASSSSQSGDRTKVAGATPQSLNAQKQAGSGSTAAPAGTSNTARITSQMVEEQSAAQVRANQETYTPRACAVADDWNRFFTQMNDNSRAQREYMMENPSLRSITDYVTLNFTAANRQRAEEMLNGPGLYSIADYFSYGAVGTIDRSVNPEVPLSPEHWMDSLAAAAWLTGAYQLGTSGAGLAADPSLNGNPYQHIAPTTVPATMSQESTRVGRWMSQAEYELMVQTGRVQVSPGGAGGVHVAYPSDPSAFGKSAPSGSLYVEFTVPTNTIKITGENWGRIMGPTGPEGRLLQQKGITPPPLPKAVDIEILINNS